MRNFFLFEDNLLNFKDKETYRMHNYRKQIKAFALCLALAFPVSFLLVPSHQSEAKDAQDIVAVKQEQKEVKDISSDKQEQKDAKAATTNKPEQKTSKDKKAHKKHKKDKHKKVEENKAPEIKPVEQPPPPPPPPVTPDKKKYASPGGNQVMTDGSIIDFRSAGVIFMHGYRYSYYSSNVLYHYRTPEWFACDDHLYRTADGHIVVASGDHPQGTIVPTPFGPGKVLDHCYASGTIDIYVNF